MKTVFQLCLLFILLPKLFFAADKYQWKNVVIGGGGFVTGIITCPQEKNLIYARTDVRGAYRVNDAANEFGGTGNANEVLGDPRVYGRVYMSTAGRGIVYGDLIDGPDANFVYDTEYLPTAVSLLELNKEPLLKLQQDHNTSSIRIVSEEKGRYEIYSISGLLVDKGRCETSKEIAVRLHFGMYILRFTSDTGKSAAEKFMIGR